MAAAMHISRYTGSTRFRLTSRLAAVRIGFSNVTNPAFYNHYKVYEIEAWGMGQN